MNIRVTCYHFCKPWFANYSVLIIGNLSLDASTQILPHLLQTGCRKHKTLHSLYLGGTCLDHPVQLYLFYFAQILVHICTYETVRGLVLSESNERWYGILYNCHHNKYNGTKIRAAVHYGSFKGVCGDLQSHLQN